MSSKESRRSSAQLLRRFAARNTGSADTTPDTAPPPTYDASARDAQVEDPPPAIAQAQGAPGDAETANLTAAFENLNLTNLPADPTVEPCLAHLKLLFAIQWMKEDVGFTDGLWGLWDARAGPVDPVLKGRPEKEKTNEKGGPEPSAAEKLRNKNLLTLSKIREKRWALFVARAVDRYETWWKSLMRVLPTRPLTETDMNIAGFEMYADFPTRVDSLLGVTEDMLPPLGKPALAPSPPALFITNSPLRRPHGLAYSHAEPSRLPRRRHAGRTQAVLGHGNAVGSRRQGH